MWTPIGIHSSPFPPSWQKLQGIRAAVQVEAEAQRRHYLDSEQIPEKSLPKRGWQIEIMRKSLSLHLLNAKKLPISTHTKA